MALPFDLRACASFDDADEPAFSTPDTSKRVRVRARPSRAVVIAPSVVDGIRARDVGALRELVQLVYVPLVRFARTIVLSYDEAEDVVQDVFAALWDRAERWEPGIDAGAYLFASVRNQALKELRRRERAERRALRAQAEWTSSTASDNRADSADSALDRVVASETDAAQARAVYAVLETLTERQRTTYDLRYHRGLTVPAIAEVLGITVKGAEQLVRRVTHVVRARLLEH